MADLLTNPDAAAQPLLIGNAAHLLAAVILTTFPTPHAPDSTIEDRHDATPATLRRAVTFIQESAARDIGVADITAANVSIRAIQLASLVSAARRACGVA